MASTFGSFEIAKSGMRTYNAALQTTAHNIANIATEGYSRQRTVRSSMVANRTSLLVQGFGVDVSTIVRDRNEYFDTKYQKTMSTYSKYNTESFYLNRMQDVVCGNVVGEDESLMLDAFNRFFASLSELKGNENNSTVRTKVVTEAQTFTSFVTQMGTDLQNLQQEVNNEIKTTIEQINAYAEQIADVTRQINTVEAYGSVANDLRDQRSLLLDKLSQLCSIDVKEIPPSDGIGVPQFYVYVNGGALVDTYNVNKLVAEQKDTYSNINDIPGCFEVKWANGNAFNEHSRAIGGTLQALFEMRDGNNDTILKGTAAELRNNETGNIVLTLTGANINEIERLNIPAHDGELTINNVTYAYEEFNVTVDEDGNFTYEFVLRSKSDVGDATALQNAVAKGYTVNVGTAVNAKGIPYYMAQLNELIRTFAEKFNEIQNGGHDLYNNMGIDFFNSEVPTTGDNYVFTEKGDGNYASFDSVAKQNDDGTYTGSYYYMTVLNFCITKEVMDDPSLIACKQVMEDGQEIGSDAGENLQRLTELWDDANMFVHGKPGDFIMSLTATLGVNASRASNLAESQNNLLYAVDTNRKSVSGVDEDEEGADMIVFNQMLVNQYKVLSVMNEVLDKLINGTAV
ncbi:MAG: flagellar hook-associated protein FlgK [Lachnospiraceae bacterium]|nr:flagellar hook-associated protein FlgK [Lachnospiraceae bacterium]